MVVLTVKHFNKIKDYIHPNLQTIIKDYQNGNLIIVYLHSMAAAIKIEIELGK